MNSISGKRSINETINFKIVYLFYITVIPFNFLIKKKEIARNLVVKNPTQSLWKSVPGRFCSKFRNKFPKGSSSKVLMGTRLGTLPTPTKSPQSSKGAALDYYVVPIKNKK